MALDLRDNLDATLQLHPRLVQQGLYSRSEDRARLVAALPPLVPFGTAQYVGAHWLLDWDHRLPSRHATLRVYAFYGESTRAETTRKLEQRRQEIAREDLYPEFDVPDFAGMPADETYEAEVELDGSPARLRLVSEWRREIDLMIGNSAVEVVRASDTFRDLRKVATIRPASLGDLEAAEWAPPCESGHVRWGIDVWYLMTFNGMVGEGRAFLVDIEERRVVRERDFQFRAG